MIRYQLRCDADHDFESWFRDSAAYESQRKKQLVACPVCGSAKVEKAIMAPALGRGTKKFADQPAPAPAETPATEAPQPVALISDKERELREMLRAVREHVVKNSDYVGDEFATVARQMHEGEVEKRSIYGEASAEEVKSLIEDEIEIHPLPTLPDERN